MQIDQLYRQTVARLQQAGIESPQSDAAQLFEHVLGVNRNQLFLHPDQTITGDQEKLLEKALCRRLGREPLQYIIGTREFWSLDFEVSPAVLIPRPETEFLLDRVLDAVNRAGYQKGPVLDMCTGSGVIAVVIALELQATMVCAVDKSAAALQVAAANVRKHVRPGLIHLLCADLFTGIRAVPMFEIIIANPPYIANDDFASLQPEVRDWEPETALLAGRRGLNVIEQLSLYGHEYLRPGGWLFVEIGADQEGAVTELFTAHAYGMYESVEVLRDWSGRPRVLQAKKKERENG